LGGQPLFPAGEIRLDRRDREAAPGNETALLELHNERQWRCSQKPESEGLAMKRFVMFAAIAAAVLFGSWPASAQHGHGSHGAGHAAPGMKMDQKEVLVEGVKVIFQIMPNSEHKKMLVEMKSKEEPEPGTSHNIAVVLIDAASQKEIPDAQARMKVIDPKGQEKTKDLRGSAEMKSYDNYFDLSTKGQYQLLVAFKVGDKTRSAGVYYDMK
jgi:hypothetical protein